MNNVTPFASTSIFLQVPTVSPRESTRNSEQLAYLNLLGAVLNKPTREVVASASAGTRNQTTKTTPLPF